MTRRALRERTQRIDTVSAADPRAAFGLVSSLTARKWSSRIQGSIGSQRSAQVRAHWHPGQQTVETIAMRGDHTEWSFGCFGPRSSPSTGKIAEHSTRAGASDDNAEEHY